MVKVKGWIDDGSGGAVAQPDIPEKHFGIMWSAASRHVPQPKIRIQDAQHPATKQNIKIQDPLDLTKKIA